MLASMLLTEFSLWAGWVLFTPVLLAAAAKAPWVELLSDSRRQHLLFGTVIALCLLWMVRRDFPNGISIHFIGMTSVTLLLGWPLAILSGFFAQLFLVLVGKPELASVALNGFILVAMPVLITETAARFVERLQPENLFVYIFCSCFFPAALTAIVCISMGFGILLVNQIFIFPPWLDEYFGVTLMVAFPEAFINGTVITALVVFKPQWLETFNHSRYLSAPWKDKTNPDDESR